VERGWARYKTRFKTIEIPESLRALREAWERRARGIVSREALDLWSDKGIGRERLLEETLALAARHKWFVRVDPGWSPWDVRFYGDRWCKVDVATVTENHGEGKRLTRLRMRMRSTLYNNALVALLAYVLVLGGVVDHRWGIVMAPFFAAILWRLGSSRRRLGRTVLACVLTTADTLGMSVVGAAQVLGREKDRADPAAGAPAQGVTTPTGEALKL
jgi:hypothetical protein